MAPRFALTVGKQAIQLSGYEYWVDAIRVREFSDFNNYIECYQAGVNGAVSLSPTQTLNLQVVNNSAGMMVFWLLFWFLVLRRQRNV